jgi:CheY-like chemotaxis protein
MPDVVGAAIDAIRPAAQARNIRVTTTVDGRDLTVSGDPGRLQQVMWNLLSNAVRFTPIDGQIAVRIARRGTAIDVIVRDSGPGIDAAFLPHAFERFRQGAAGTTRAHGGLGLGLAIVRHLVELHGGTVVVTNNAPEPGATFSITLPAPPAAVIGAAEPAAKKARSPRRAYRLDGVRVLVTDDDMSAREMLAVVLENAGAEVRTASSSEDALMILETSSADVLVSDIEMPGEDGYRLAERVRRLASTGDGFIAVAVTAHARPDDRARASAAGFNAHLAKPIDPAELLAVLATLVQQKGLDDPRIAEPLTNS